MKRKTLDQSLKLTATELIFVIAFLAILVAQANAISLFNADAVPHEVQVLAHPGLDPEDVLVIRSGEMVDGLCDDGCTLLLRGWPPETFTGDEELSIKNGAFTITR